MRAVARLFAFADKRNLEFRHLAQKIRRKFVHFDRKLFFPKLLTFPCFYDIIVLSVRGVQISLKKIFLKKFEKPIDKSLDLWYNIIVPRGAEREETKCKYLLIKSKQ